VGSCLRNLSMPNLSRSRLQSKDGSICVPYRIPPLYVRLTLGNSNLSNMQTPPGIDTRCCGCPTCRFPSRRDIVEESIAGFLRGPSGSLMCQGMEELVSNFSPLEGVSAIKRRSERIEQKHPHLPRAFADATVGVDGPFFCWAPRSSTSWEELRGRDLPFAYNANIC